MKYSRPIWELMGECAQTLPDQFRFGHVQRWFEAYYPDINEHTLRVHLAGLTEMPNNPNPYLAKKDALFRRVSHGEYEVIGRRADSRAAVDGPAPDGTAASHVAPAAHPTGRLILLGHEHEQRDTPARARDLFISDRFVADRHEAESSGSQWYILSSEYGLLHPGTVVSPYARRLGSESASFRRAWAQWVTVKLDSELDGIEDSTIEVHAGHEFADVLVTVLESHGARVAATE